MKRPMTALFLSLCLLAPGLDAAAQEDAQAPELEEVMFRLAGLESWRAAVRLNQRAGVMPVKAAGTVAVRDNEAVRLDLAADIPGLSMPNRFLVILNPDGMWGEQTMFSKKVLFTARPHVEAARFEYFLQLVGSGGYTVGRLNLDEAVWWADAGWSLEAQPPDPDQPERWHYRGALKSIKHAKALFAQPWSGNEMEILDLFVSRDSLYPVQWKLTGKDGMTTYELYFEEIERDPDFEADTFDYTPPAELNPSDMTDTYRPRIERRLDLKGETEADERKVH